jgi:hypothetical protein
MEELGPNAPKVRHDQKTRRALSFRAGDQSALLTHGFPLGKGSH